MLIGAGIVLGALSSPAAAQMRNPWVIVPDFYGVDYRQAMDLLRKYELEIGSLKGLDVDRPGGWVIQQRPSPGTRVTRGDSIDLAFSRTQPPPRRVTVPRVTGMAEDAAMRALRASRLVPGSISRQPSPSSLGTVLDQAPQAGAPVEPGSAVNLVIAAALPAPPVLATVPRVVGLNPSAARVRVEAQYLVLEGDPGDGQPRIVVKQDPEAGTSIPRGSVVRVQLQDLTATVHADPAAPSAGETVRLSVALSHSLRGATYRFQLGDGSESPALAEGTYPHVYRAAGMYPVQASVTTRNGLVLQTQPISVVVEAGLPWGRALPWWMVVVVGVPLATWGAKKAMDRIRKPDPSNRVDLRAAGPIDISVRPRGEVSSCDLRISPGSTLRVDVSSPDVEIRERAEA